MKNKYGIVIRGENRQVQIDSHNQVMCCLGRRVIRMTGGITSNNEGYSQEFTIPPHPNTKLLAISPKHAFIRITSRIVNNKMKAVYISQPCYDSEGIVDIYEFGDQPNNIFNEKYGLVVKNSKTKKTVYNSNWGILKIVDYFIVPQKENINYPLPNIKDLAFVFGGGMAGICEDGFEGALMETFIRREGNVLQIRYKEIIKWATNVAREEISRFPATCLVIDVGNINRVL